LVLDKKIDIDKIKSKNFYGFRDSFDVVPVFEKMELMYDESLKTY